MYAVSFYGNKVPADGLLIRANPGIPATLHITMASIDPTEDPIDGDDAKPFTTLKLLRNPFGVLDGEDDEDDEDDDDEDIDEDDIDSIRRRLGLAEDDDDEDEEDDEDEDDEDEDDDDDDDENEGLNGGPSDPEKIRKAREAAFKKALKEAEDDVEMDDALENGINGKFNKGKARVTSSDDDSEESGYFQVTREFVVCTLDVTKNLQQPLDIFLRQDEECYLRVVGNRSVHLTGNYVMRPEELASDDEEEDEDDMLDTDGLYGFDEIDEMEESDLEIDELDDLDEPRIVELLAGDDEVPKLVKVTKGKGKRAALELDSDEVDAALDKVLGLKESNGVEKKTKHQAKKLKNNEGKPVAGVEPVNGTSKKDSKAKDDKKAEASAPIKNGETKKDTKSKQTEKKTDTPNGSAKKVQFAEKLEQGPTPSGSAGVRVVKGVNVDDRKAGTGPAAKKGDKVAMRYIGKLDDGKVFDANKKGKPFTFKLGTGAVIKGWDIGVDGMRVGGERRIVIPANLAYGSQSLPGIPANSQLTFDIKMLSIN